MGNLLLVLAILVIILAAALFLLNAKYQMDKAERHVMTPEQERQYEIEPSVVVTAENVKGILDWQIQKANGEVATDHPAFARRKAG